MCEEEYQGHLGNRQSSLAELRKAINNFKQYLSHIEATVNDSSMPPITIITIARHINHTERSFRAKLCNDLNLSLDPAPSDIPQV